jgi:type IV pilus assembly protein PilP
MKITVMCKSIQFNRTVACVLFLFFLVLGCEDATQPPAKPIVIKKRITEQSHPAESEKVVKPAVTVAESQPLPPEKVASVPVPPPSSEPLTPATSEGKVDAGAPASLPPLPSESLAPGVSGEKADAAAMEGESTTAAGAETALAEKLADASPRYDPTGKVDPFAPIFKETPTVSMESGEKKIIRRRPLTPLEKIDLSQLKLVGVIRAESGNHAMVEDATGKGYVITKGAYVGIYGGRVVQIERDRVFIEEEVEDIFGKISVSRKELKLQKPPGEE